MSVISNGQTDIQCTESAKKIEVLLGTSTDPFVGEKKFPDDRQIVHGQRTIDPYNLNDSFHTPTINRPAALELTDSIDPILKSAQPSIAMNSEEPGSNEAYELRHEQTGIAFDKVTAGMIKEGASGITVVIETGNVADPTIVALVSKPTHTLVDRPMPIKEDLLNDSVNAVPIIVIIEDKNDTGMRALQRPPIEVVDMSDTSGTELTAREEFTSLFTASMLTKIGDCNYRGPLGNCRLPLKYFAVHDISTNAFFEVGDILENKVFICGSVKTYQFNSVKLLYFLSYHFLLKNEDDLPELLTNEAEVNKVLHIYEMEEFIATHDLKHFRLDNKRKKVFLKGVQSMLAANGNNEFVATFENFACNFDSKSNSKVVSAGSSQNSNAIECDSNEDVDFDLHELVDPKHRPKPAGNSIKASNEVKNKSSNPKPSQKHQEGVFDQQVKDIPHHRVSKKPELFAEISEPVSGITSGKPTKKVPFVTIKKEDKPAKCYVKKQIIKEIKSNKVHKELNDPKKPDEVSALPSIAFSTTVNNTEEDKRMVIMQIQIDNMQQRMIVSDTLAKLSSVANNQEIKIAVKATKSSRKVVEEASDDSSSDDSDAAVQTRKVQKTKAVSSRSKNAKINKDKNDGSYNFSTNNNATSKNNNSDSYNSRNNNHNSNNNLRDQNSSVAFSDNNGDGINNNNNNNNNNQCHNNNHSNNHNNSNLSNNNINQYNNNNNNRGGGNSSNNNNGGGYSVNNSSGGGNNSNDSGSRSINNNGEGNVSNHGRVNYSNSNNGGNSNSNMGGDNNNNNNGGDISVNNNNYNNNNNSNSNIQSNNNNYNTNNNNHNNNHNNSNLSNNNQYNNNNNNRGGGNSSNNNNGGGYSVNNSSGGGNNSNDSGSRSINNNGEGNVSNHGRGNYSNSNNGGNSNNNMGGDNNNNNNGGDNNFHDQRFSNGGNNSNYNSNSNSSSQSNNAGGNRSGSNDNSNCDNVFQNRGSNNGIGNNNTNNASRSFYPPSYSRNDNGGGVNNSTGNWRRCNDDGGSYNGNYNN